MNSVTPHAVLYIETYPTGSHLRTVELLCRHSVHNIQVVNADRDEWRWITGAAHHHLARKVQTSLNSHFDPDLILVSGPINLAGLVALLPPELREIPLVTYFHESQWTYPNPPGEILPYLLGHIDSIVLSDEVWFNSQFHRDVFFANAFDSSIARMRNLARNTIEGSFERSRVIYPSVELDFRRGEVVPGNDRPTIAWVARWEAEKRPDVFVEAMNRLRNRCEDVDLIVLGPGAGPSMNSDPHYLGIADLVKIQGPLANRDAYEAALAQADVVVSTAEHEFFGIAVLEAVQAGAAPVLPRNLAYPETIPSAWFYRTGDIDHLVDVMSRVLHTPTIHRTCLSDARRFRPSNTVVEFDRAVQCAISTYKSENEDQKARP